MIDAETMLDRIAAADTLSDLESLRVAALGKAGTVTAHAQVPRRDGRGNPRHRRAEIHALARTR